MNKKLLAIITILGIAILASINLLKPGFFSMHDDLQVMRLYEMKKCLNDGQIPCRWSPDMSAGYGQPMFNYYSATPYYTGAIINSFGFSFVDSTKIVMFISIALAGVAMFLFLSELFPLFPSTLGAIAYIFVPFRALEIFVRGALAENFALAILPLVLFGVIRLIKKHDKTSFVLLSLFTGLFLSTHNITSLIAAPLILIFSLIFVLLEKNKIKNLLLLVGSAGIGVGLASFFLLPVIFESNLVNTTSLTSGYFDFRGHFVTLRQLFINQSWGYGASEFGPNDNLSFSVGIVQTLALLLTPLFVFIKRKSLKLNHKIIFGTFWILGIYFIFLTTARSIVDWNLFSPLRFVQFPWRLLGLVSVCTSVVIAILISVFNQKNQKILSIIFLLSLILFNLRFFKFEKYNPDATDATLLTGEYYEQMQRSAIQDYQPLSMAIIPEKIAPSNPIVLSGLAEVKNFQKRSAYFSADVDVSVGKATVSFPITSFPNWKIYLNSAIVATPYEIGNDFGEITLTFDKGITLVQGYFEDTKIRTLANTITFISLLLILVIVTVPYDKKHNQ